MDADIRDPFSKFDGVTTVQANNDAAPKEINNEHTLITKTSRRLFPCD